MGADIEAPLGEGRPTVGNVVRTVSGDGVDSLATVTEDDRSSIPYKLEGDSCGSGWYTEAQVTLRVTPLCFAAVVCSLPAVRLLLERGAKADGESGAVALRAATSDDVKTLLREHGATLTLHEECKTDN
jgi:hypothetical protein